MNSLPRAKMSLSNVSIKAIILLVVSGIGWIVLTKLSGVNLYSNVNLDITPSTTYAPAAPMTLPKRELTLTARIASASAVPTEWMTYKNEKYGYIITYPKHWDAIDATKQITPDTQYISMEYLEGDQIQRVNFIEDSPNVSYGRLETGIFANPSDENLEQWTDNFRLRFAGGETKPSNIQDVLLGGKPAKAIRLKPFSVDDFGIMIVTIYRKNVYYITFADYSVINDTSITSSLLSPAPQDDWWTEITLSDKMRKRNEKIYDQILSSYMFFR